MGTMTTYVFFLIPFVANGLGGFDMKPKRKHNHKHSRKDDHTNVSQVRQYVQTGQGPYSKLPNFTLMSRVYISAEEELNTFLLPSYNVLAIEFFVAEFEIDAYMGRRESA